MEAILVTFFVVIFILVVIAFIHHAIKLRQYKNAEQRCLDLTRFIRQSYSHEEWSYWRGQANEFLLQCQESLSVDEFKKYAKHLDEVLSDKLAFLAHKK